MKCTLVLLFSFFFSIPFSFSKGTYVNDQNIDHYVQDSDFRSVTNKFGKLQIAKNLVGSSEMAESIHKPWSSWWYPHFEREMFDLYTSRKVNISPLGRYDNYVSITQGRNSEAVDYESEKIHDPRAVSWSGHCDAWSFASVMTKEPIRPITKRGLTFSVKDQKALLLKSYEIVTGFEFFGQRNNNEWDDVYADVYPDQFHKFTQHQLFKNKKPFIIDTDATMQVWNNPVFKVKFKYSFADSSKKVIAVKAFVSIASPRVDDRNYVGTKTVQKIYTYNLYINSENSSHYVISRGEWTNNSRWDHPDYIMSPPQSGMARKSRNIHIDPRIVDEIVR